MNKKGLLKQVALILLLALVCTSSLESFSNGESVDSPVTTEERLDMTIFMTDKGGSLTDDIVKNLVITFVNATTPTVNTSLPAFYDGFVNARFSLVVQGRASLYLRVSYDNKTNPDQADAYADHVLEEFRKAFNIPLNVQNKTHVVGDENPSTDVYFMLGDVEQTPEYFAEFAKYVPSEGFGSLVNRDMLSHYLPSNDSDHIFLIEYNLNKVNQSFVLEFRLELGHQLDYSGEKYIDINLNELLNRTGQLIPSTLRHSQARVYVYKTQFTNKRVPLGLTINSSLPAYTSLEDLGDEWELTYNLTGPFDNVAVILSVAPEPGFNWIYVAVVAVAAIAASIAIFAFVKHRKQNAEAEGNRDTGLKQDANMALCRSLRLKYIRWLNTRQTNWTDAQIWKISAGFGSSFRSPNTKPS